MHQDKAPHSPVSDRYLESEVNVSYLQNKQHYCNAARQKRDAMSTRRTTSDCPKKHNEKSVPDGYKNVKNESPGSPNNASGGDGTQGSPRKRKFELSSHDVTPARSPLGAPKGTHKSKKTGERRHREDCQGVKYAET